VKLARNLGSAVLAFFCSASLYAQEAKYIDLSDISQRTTLRHPPSPPSKCDGPRPCGVGGGGGGGGVADGAPDIRDPHALGIYLESVSPTEITSDEPFEVEFKVLNTGSVPITLPVSPHLSDLQPEDDSAPFKYSSLALVVRVDGEHPSCVPCVAYAQLYGRHDKTETLVTLRPNEWIRVKAKLSIQQPVVGAAQLRGEFWLRSNTFTPREGGGFTMMVNLYPNLTTTPAVQVQFLTPKK
jgi:hypothetical protein